MRTYSRVFASLLIAFAIVFAGLTTSSAQADTVTHDRADTVLSWAKKLKGKPYRWGGAGPRSFDCAGYVQYVYGKAGKKIGRTSGAQLKGKRIAKRNKKPGDIMVFLRGGSAYHSAIYAGSGTMWEAQRTGVPVGRHRIWSQGYVVVRPSGGLSMTSTNQGVSTPGTLSVSR
ncbi:MAG: hypothetical protein JWP31_281 [Aeromicrobium sp.]|nr:hypothetical protein [Aeromicrobium sp.]